MSQSSPIRTERAVAVGVFEGGREAEQAVEALRELGVAERQIGLLRPEAVAPAAGDADPKLSATEDTGLLAPAAAGGDLAGLLVGLGVPEGEARFYAHEVQAGRWLVAAAPGQASYAQARDLLLRHGGRDVQSEGQQLARGGDFPDGMPSGAALATDVTDRWEDVRSRYEMLFEQHYGTSDTTWPQAEPLYRYAWQMANSPDRRGRPWSEVEASLRRDWEAQGREPGWAEAAGPMRDVWEDVAAESTTAEGGAERRISRQGADQSGPARNVTPPPGPA